MAMVTGADVLKIINGSAELIVAGFGEVGRQARAASVSGPSLWLDVAVEIRGNC